MALQPTRIPRLLTCPVDDAELVQYFSRTGWDLNVTSIPGLHGTNAKFILLQALHRLRGMAAAGLIAQHSSEAIAEAVIQACLPSSMPASPLQARVALVSHLLTALASCSNLHVFSDTEAGDSAHIAFDITFLSQFHAIAAAAGPAATREAAGIAVDCVWPPPLHVAMSQTPMTFPQQHAAMITVAHIATRTLELDSAAWGACAAMLASGMLRCVELLNQLVVAAHAKSVDATMSDAQSKLHASVHMRMLPTMLAIACAGAYNARWCEVLLPHVQALVRAFTAWALLTDTLMKDLQDTALQALWAAAVSAHSPSRAGLSAASTAAAADMARRAAADHAGTSTATTLGAVCDSGPAALLHSALVTAARLAAGMARGDVVTEEECIASPWLAAGVAGAGVASLSVHAGAGPCSSASFDALPHALADAVETTTQSILLESAALHGETPGWLDAVCLPASAPSRAASKLSAGELPSTLRAAASADAAGRSAEPAACVAYLRTLFEASECPPQLFSAAGTVASYGRLIEAHPDILGQELGDRARLMASYSRDVDTWYRPTPTGAALRRWLHDWHPLKGLRAKKDKHHKYEHAEVLVLAACLARAPEQDLWREAAAASAAIAAGEEPATPSALMQAAWHSVFAVRVWLAKQQAASKQEPASGGDAGMGASTTRLAPGATAAAAAAPESDAAPAGSENEQDAREEAPADPASRARLSAQRGMRTLVPVLPRDWFTFYADIVARAGALAGGDVWTCVSPCSLPLQHAAAAQPGWLAALDAASPWADHAAGMDEEDMGDLDGVVSQFDAAVGASAAPVAVRVALAPTCSGRAPAPDAPALSAASQQAADACRAAVAACADSPAPGWVLPNEWTHQAMTRARAQGTADVTGPSAAFRAVQLYLSEGAALPPPALVAMALARSHRAARRTAGLRVLHELRAFVADAWHSASALVVRSDADLLASGVLALQCNSERRIARGIESASGSIVADNSTCAAARLNVRVGAGHQLGHTASAGTHAKDRASAAQADGYGVLSKRWELTCNAANVVGATLRAGVQFGKDASSEEPQGAPLSSAHNAGIADLERAAVVAPHAACLALDASSMLSIGTVWALGGIRAVSNSLLTNRGKRLAADSAASEPCDVHARVSASSHGVPGAVLDALDEQLGELVRAATATYTGELCAQVGVAQALLPIVYTLACHAMVLGHVATLRVSQPQLAAEHWAAWHCCAASAAACGGHAAAPWDGGHAKPGLSSWRPAPRNVLVGLLRSGSVPVPAVVTWLMAVCQQVDIPVPSALCQAAPMPELRALDTSRLAPSLELQDHIQHMRTLPSSSLAALERLPVATVIAMYDEVLATLPQPLFRSALRFAVQDPAAPAAHVPLHDVDVQLAVMADQVCPSVAAFRDGAWGLQRLSTTLFAADKPAGRWAVCMVLWAMATAMHDGEGAWAPWHRAVHAAWQGEPVELAVPQLVPALLAAVEAAQAAGFDNWKALLAWRGHFELQGLDACRSLTQLWAGREAPHGTEVLLGSCVATSLQLLQAVPLGLRPCLLSLVQQALPMIAPSDAATLASVAGLNPTGGLASVHSLPEALLNTTSTGGWSNSDLPAVKHAGQAQDANAVAASAAAVLQTCIQHSDQWRDAVSGALTSVLSAAATSCRRGTTEEHILQPAIAALRVLGSSWFTLAPGSRAAPATEPTLSTSHAGSVHSSSPGLQALASSGHGRLVQCYAPGSSVMVVAVPSSLPELPAHFMQGTGSGRPWVLVSVPLHALELALPHTHRRTLFLALAGSPQASVEVPLARLLSIAAEVLLRANDVGATHYELVLGVLSVLRAALQQFPQAAALVAKSSAMPLLAKLASLPRPVHHGAWGALPIGMPFHERLCFALWSRRVEGQVLSQLLQEPDAPTLYCSGRDASALTAGVHHVRAASPDMEMDMDVDMSADESKASQSGDEQSCDQELVPMPRNPAPGGVNQELWSIADCGLAPASGGRWSTQDCYAVLVAHGGDSSASWAWLAEADERQVAQLRDKLGLGADMSVSLPESGMQAALADVTMKVPLIATRGYVAWAKPNGPGSHKDSADALTSTATDNDVRPAPLQRLHSDGALEGLGRGSMGSAMTVTPLVALRAKYGLVPLHRMMTPGTLLAVSSKPLRAGMLTESTHSMACAGSGFLALGSVPTYASAAAAKLSLLGSAAAAMPGNGTTRALNAWTGADTQSPVQMAALAGHLPALLGSGLADALPVAFTQADGTSSVVLVPVSHLAVCTSVLDLTTPAMVRRCYEQRVMGLMSSASIALARTVTVDTMQAVMATHGLQGLHPAVQSAPLLLRLLRVLCAERPIPLGPLPAQTSVPADSSDSTERWDVLLRALTAACAASLQGQPAGAPAAVTPQVLRGSMLYRVAEAVAAGGSISDPAVLLGPPLLAEPEAPEQIIAALTSEAAAHLAVYATVEHAREASRHAQAAASADHSGEHETPRAVSSVLRKAQHLQAQPKRAVYVESEHPALPESQGALHLPGAEFVWVTFHSNTCTDPDDDTAFLQFSADPYQQQVVCTLRGLSHNFTPMLLPLHDGKLYVRHCVGRATRSRMGDFKWGYGLTGYAATGAVWCNEVQAVAGHPSLRWGLQLLQALQSHLPLKVLERGVLHNSGMVELLLDTLCSGGAPFKGMLVSALCRLLSLPVLFSTAAPPPVDRILDEVSALLNSLPQSNAGRRDDGQDAFLPVPVLQFYELAATAKAAQRLLTDKWSLFTPVVSLQLPQFALADASGPSSLSDGTTCLSGPPEEWFPPCGTPTMPPELSKMHAMPVMDAMAAVREILKSLACGARIPDSWMVRAMEYAYDGGPEAADLTKRRAKGKPPFRLNLRDLPPVQRSQLAITLYGHAARQASSASTKDSGARPAWLEAVGEIPDAELSTYSAAARALAPQLDQAIIQWLEHAAAAIDVPMIDCPVWEMTVSDDDVAANPALRCVELGTLRQRAALLVVINRLLTRCLGYVDTSGASGEWSVGALLRVVPQIVFAETKDRLISLAIQQSQTFEDSNVSVNLDNARAAASVESGDTSYLTTECLFAQLFRALRAHRAARLRSALDSKDRLFRVTFVNEPGVDWGGLYRDCMERVVADLFSGATPHIDLFVRAGSHSSAGAADGGGAGAAAAGGSAAGGGGGLDDDEASVLASLASPDDVWVPNCALLSNSGPSPDREDANALTRALAMWRLVGILMGVSWRTRAWLDFAMAPLVWRLLVQEPMTVDDLALLDVDAAARIRHLRKCVATGNAGAIEELYRGTTFVDCAPPCAGGTGEEMELIPGGRGVQVTLANAASYCSALLAARSATFSQPVSAMRAGLLSVIPERAFMLCRSTDLAVLVCGSSTIDPELLRRHTQYSAPYNENHPVVRRFWEVFCSLNPIERSLVIRFAWGRSKLPRGDSGWRTREGKPISFLIFPFYADASRGIMRGDGSLVEAHSCFFQIKLPEYSSVAIMRKQLMRSVFHSLAGGTFMLA